MARRSELTERRRREAIRRRIRRPPGHWGLLAFCVGAMLVLLLVQGFSVRTTGRSGTPAGPAARAPLAGSPPLLTGEGGRLVAHEQRPGRRLALTFDDGPDPRWTPRIAAALRRLGVPATFFVIGSQAVRHPDVVRMLRRDGFELGNHTFTHSDLAALSQWERSLQLGLTQSALSGIAGVRTRLLRPPYSSEPNAITPQQERALEDVAGAGYLVVLADFDGEDWRRPGVREIARAITPKHRSGGIILLHDGGGNRSETVAALNLVIPRLKARGFHFVRVSDLAGVPQSAVELPATGSEKLRGRLLLATLSVARFITGVATFALFAIAVLVLLRTLILLALARRHVRTTRAVPADPSYAPPVSVVVPACNERVNIERTLRALAASDYPDFEVVVVDDGSGDGTGDIVEALGLERVRLVRQANLGKPAALNAGIAAARNDLIATADADTLFEPGSLRSLVQPFRDPGVGAACGNTKVGNRRGLLGRWQHIEYVMGFNLDRRLYDILLCMPTVPGAIGAFRREALTDIGGISAETLAEDTDATIAVGRAGWRVSYVEGARGWTEAPASVGALWRQRYRWSFGTMQATWKHRAALWRPGEERIGRRGIPYLVLFQIALPMLAPLVDVFALYGLLFLDPLVVAAYWGGFNALQLLLAVYAFRLDRESLKPLWTMPLQQFFYRQLMYLVVIESAASALRGVQLRWHRSERSGDAEIGSGRPAGARG